MRLIPKSIERLLILIFICMTVALVVNAQTPPPSGGTTVGAPIDGLSGLLMAAGAGYAARHIYRNNRRNTPKT
jgi:hypothetical protein